MERIMIQVDESDIITSRDTGLILRLVIEQKLATTSDPILLDFSQIKTATHSCLDELIGTLVVREGAGILERLFFLGCSPAIQSMIQFIIADRSSQNREATSH